MWQCPTSFCFLLSVGRWFGEAVDASHECWKQEERWWGTSATLHLAAAPSFQLLQSPRTKPKQQHHWTRHERELRETVLCRQCEKLSWRSWWWSQWTHRSGFSGRSQPEVTRFDVFKDHHLRGCWRWFWCLGPAPAKDEKGFLYVVTWFWVAVPTSATSFAFECILA